MMTLQHFTEHECAINIVFTCKYADHVTVRKLQITALTFEVFLDTFNEILGAILFLFKPLLAVFNFLHQSLGLVFGVLGLLFGHIDLEITRNMFPQTIKKIPFKKVKCRA